MRPRPTPHRRNRGPQSEPHCSRARGSCSSTGETRPAAWRGAFARMRRRRVPPIAGMILYFESIRTCAAVCRHGRGQLAGRRESNGYWRTRARRRGTLHTCPSVGSITSFPSGTPSLAAFQAARPSAVKRTRRFASQPCDWFALRDVPNENVRFGPAARRFFASKCVPRPTFRRRPITHGAGDAQADLLNFN
jgi:hypothetical protein